MFQRNPPVKVFLADGTLLIDSCWETYRLEHWRTSGAGAVEWSEDGQPIRATYEASGDSLVLRLALVGGESVERYGRAPVPFVCPEMRR